MKSLKDALLKAGATPSTDAKDVNKRVKVAKKQRTETVKHQTQRNYCEDCDSVQPDVELYHHNNPTTDAEWICIRCADRLNIADKFRKTSQSDTSVRKMFRREYGETLTNAELKIEAVMAKKGPVNGNC